MCLCIIENKRKQLVLIGMQNRAFSPYLAAINNILISLMSAVYVFAVGACLVG
jgi:hypothetical protein